MFFFLFFYADHISSYSLGFLVVTTSPSRQVRISLTSLKDRIQKQDHHPIFVLLMLHPFGERFEQKEEEEDEEEVGVSDISSLLPFPVFVIKPPADPVSKLTVCFIDKEDKHRLCLCSRHFSLIF